MGRVDPTLSPSPVKGPTSPSATSPRRSTPSPTRWPTRRALAETKRQVEALGRRCVAVKADVRSTAEIEAAVAQATAELGRLDIVLANAGICGFGAFAEITDEMWDDMIDTDLTGVFKTLRATVPHLVERGGGRIVATSSMGGKMGNPDLAHYATPPSGA